MKGQRKGCTEWAAEEIEWLRYWWSVEKMPATAIARRLPGRNKNMVIGKVHRLDIGGKNRWRPTSRPGTPEPGAPPPPVAVLPPLAPVAPRNPGRPLRNMPVTAQTLPPRINVRKVTIPLPMLREIEAPSTARNVTLLQRTRRQCGWPVNDGGPFLFCGAAKAGRNYCEEHERLAIRPPAARRAA